MNSHPSRQPAFAMPWQERQSRLTTFFRLILAIPPMLLIAIWAIALLITVPIAWFALLFTGRYPQGLYDFHANFARYVARAYGYLLLATDKWPGFSADEGDGYPVRLIIGDPLPVYSRLKVGLRLPLLIPVYLIVYAMQLVAEIAALLAWFVIVFTGKLPQGLYQMLRLGISYQARANPYFLLLTEDWPSFTVEEPGEPVAQVPGGSAPAIGSGPAIAPAPPGSSAPPNLGDFRPPAPPDDAA